MDYIDLKYKPKKEDVVCLFRVEPNKISFEKAANTIALESSIGTWTDLITMNKNIKKLRARVFEMSKKKKEIKIAYPIELFEKGNMPQVMSSIGGNIYGMKAVKGLRLQDVKWSSKIMKSLKGPRYGIKGIRRILKIKKRPLVGTIVKPKVGLRSGEHAKVAYESWVNGLDLVKADENLTSMTFNKFENNVKKTLKMRDKAEKETGEKKIYVPNVTAETKEMIKRAKFVKRNGGRCVMLDIITTGWGALQTLRNEDLGLILHGHRSGYAMFSRNPKHGMSMLVIAEIARLIGIDQLHVGALMKMEGESKVVKNITEAIEKEIIKEDKSSHVLAEDWGKIKPVFAICSGGVHAGSVPKLVKLLGDDIIIQAGGGVHSLGTNIGARAMRQSVDAVMEGTSLKEYAKTHKELKKSLNKWGIVK